MLREEKKTNSENVLCKEMSKYRIHYQNYPKILKLFLKGIFNPYIKLKVIGYLNLTSSRSNQKYSQTLLTNF